jgi:ribonucleoside-diphosphate reductase alpha chain
MAFEQTSLPYYSEFIHLSRYSRWREDLGRRETWEETVDRLINFWIKQVEKADEY